MLKLSQTKALLCLTLVLVTLAIYWPVRTHDFINYDDPDYVSANPVVQHGLTWAGVKWAFTTTHSYNWHPVTWISHMLDVQLFGMNPGAHHLVSVFLHIANALVLFWVLQRLTGAAWRSAFVAAVFAWHPLHLESVAWACERKDVLSTLFWMLTTWTYIRFTEYKVRPSSPQARRWYTVSVLCFTLGLMAKPMLVTLPFVLLLLDLWPLRRVAEASANKQKQVEPAEIRWAKFKPLLREKLPFFALTIVSCIITFIAQQQEGAVVKLQHFPLADRLGNALVSYIRYIGKTIWPKDLVIFYEPPTGWGLGLIFGSAILITLCSVFAILQLRKRTYLAVGWFWFLGTLVPVIGIVQVGMQSIADRYMYVPMIGLLIAFAWGMADLFRGKFANRLAPVIAVLLLLTCLVLTRQQLAHWKNSESIFRHVLSVNPNHVMAHVMLGNAFAEQQKFDDAVSHFQEALNRQPDFAEVHFNLGNVFVAQQKVEEAIAAYKTALQHRPGYADAHGNLAVALGMAGRLEEAVEQYRLALQVTPGQPDVLRNLSIDLTAMRRFDEASVHLEQAIAANPADSLAYKLLGDVRVAQGNWLDAAAQYGTAVQLKPDFEEARQKLNLASERASGFQQKAP